MVLLKFLLPVFFIVFSLGEFTRISLGNSASLGAIDIVIAVIILIWILTVKKTSYKLKTAVVLFIAVCLASLVLSFTKFSPNELTVGFLYLVRWAMYASLYFVFRDIGKKFDRKIIIYSLFSGFTILIIGFVQFLFYPSLKNLYYLGWDDHLYRLFSSFLDPNFTGTFIVLFLIFVFVIRDRFKKSRKITYLLNFSLIFIFLGIILTYSRSALLMLTVSTLIYCFIQRNFKVILGLFATLVIVVVILSPRFYLVNTNLFRIPSLEQRINNSKEALTIYRKNPVFGVGFNNYRFAREIYGYKDTTPYGFSHSGGGVDNSFILVLVTAGIPGIAVYLFLIYKMFKLGLHQAKKNSYALILVISLGGLIANSLLLNSLFYSFIMIWVWMLAGLSESSSHRE